MDDSDGSSIEEQKNSWMMSIKCMKERLRSRCEEASFEGIREMELYHGLKLISSAPLIGSPLDICYCDDTKEYLILDTASQIYRFSIQGKPVQPSFNLSSTMAFTKFIWCRETKIFAGFVPHDDVIWILDPTCKLIQIVRNEFRVENIFYIPHTNEILVVGATKATRFPMDHKEQTLNSWRTVNILDSSFGPTWVLENSSSIQHDPLFLRLAGSYLTTVYVIPLACDKDEDSNVPVKFIAKRVNATETAITVLYFHPTSQWIMTGDQKGNVFAWNLDLECMMNCSSAHQGTVTIITSHPSICGFISCAEDNLLQVWSCNLRQKIESFNELGEISHMAVNGSASSVAAVGTKLSCFQMHQLYAFYSPLTANAMKLFATTSPIDTIRIVVCSADKIIRMLSSASGKQLNLQILPPDSTIVSLAHSTIAGRMYVVEKNCIMVSSTKINPMEIQHEWDSAGKIITCLIVYDHYEEIRGFDHGAQRTKVINPICTRIIVGTETGELISIEDTTGRQESSIPAHDEAIIQLHSSIVARQIISVSADKSLKIWRIFPDILMPLSLLHCIYYSTPISCVGSLGFTICVVCSTESSKCHQLFMYNTIERRQSEHHPSKDHVKRILAIATSESLQICATSSMDGTLRIWDHHNDLVKILEINVFAGQLAFSSLLGDIVFSAGKHLYRLPYENYLSPKYRLRISNNAIEKEEEEEQIPHDPESERIDDDIDNILHPVSSVPLGSLDPATDAPHLDLMFKEQMCMQLKYRDEDISRIQENVLHAKKMVKAKILMEQQDWEKHIDDLLGTFSKAENEVIFPHDIWSYKAKYKKIKKVVKEPDYSPMIGEIGDIHKPCLEPPAFSPNSLIIKIADKRDLKADNLDEADKPLKRREIKYNYPSEIYETIDLLSESEMIKSDEE